MNEEKSQPPVEEEILSKPAEADLKLSSSLPLPRAFTWTRSILYGAVLVVGALYFFWRTTSPSVPRNVFRNADQIHALEWPDSRTKLISEKENWVVENPSWDRAPADPTQVLTLMERLKSARGLPVRRIPPDFRLVGRLVVTTPEASRELVWHAAGADAIVESGDSRYLLPNFPVEQLFPAAENLVSRRVLSIDPALAEELSVTVVTADGDKRYRIRRDGDYYYIPGTHAHLLHTTTVTGLFRELQDMTLRRLLPTPKIPPVHADFSFSLEGVPWKLARIEASCPEGETAVARFSGRWLAGCVATRLWNRLTPSLPELLEARLLPSPASGGTWDRIEIRHTGSPAIRIGKTPKGWAFDDGTLADERVCSGTIGQWSGATVLGLETLNPTDHPDTQVIFHRGTLSFSVHLLAVNGETFIVRQGEKRRARVPRVLFDLIRTDPAWWKDRRVFPHTDIVKIQRTAGDFRETWALGPEGDWRVLEPLDQPYPAGLQREVIPRLLSLRVEVSTPAATPPVVAEVMQPSPTPTSPSALTPPPPSPTPATTTDPSWQSQKRPVLWTLTRKDNSKVQLLVSPLEDAAREGADGAKSRIRLSSDDVDFLLRPHFHLQRPAWNLREARSTMIRFPDGRGASLTFHDPHWLWTAPEGKKILPEAGAAAFFQRVGDELDHATPWDLSPIPDCPIRLTFNSDAGLKQEFCLEAHTDFLFLSRAGGFGRAVLPATFLDSLMKP
ncbi:hypothetical protein KKC22_15520 [Myxococcota bacterium]|nr:hypothetical protein [Myxococcota bacterium]